MVNHRARTQDSATLAAQRFRQRHGDYHIGLTGQAEPGYRPTPARAAHPDSMRVISQQYRFMLPAYRMQLRKWR